MTQETELLQKLEDFKDYREKHPILKKIIIESDYCDWYLYQKKVLKGKKTYNGIMDLFFWDFCKKGSIGFLISCEKYLLNKKVRKDLNLKTSWFLKETKEEKKHIFDKEMGMFNELLLAMFLEKQGNKIINLEVWDKTSSDIEICNEKIEVKTKNITMDEYNMLLGKHVVTSDNEVPNKRNGLLFCDPVRHTISYIIKKAIEQLTKIKSIKKPVIVLILDSRSQEYAQIDSFVFRHSPNIKKNLNKEEKKQLEKIRIDLYDDFVKTRLKSFYGNVFL